MDWLNIPAGLRARAQWAVAGADKAPQWLDQSGKLRYISVTEPATWGPFDKVAELAYQCGMSIGYIIAPDDPYTCIDLDVKLHPTPNQPATTPEQYARYRAIYEHMGSYTETSRSGLGLHIWVEGNIGKGVRRDGVEVYSQERFIICTGKALTPPTVVNRQSSLESMVHQMRPIRDELSPLLIEVDPRELDIDILSRGVNAANGEKFVALWEGRWGDLGYRSQSEADESLINMLAFYSPSNSQVRRMFRQSALGKREKAQRDGYINYTLVRIRNELAEVEKVNTSAMQHAMETLRLVGEATQPEPAQSQAAEIKLPPQPTAPPKNESSDDLDWPPGFVGYLAQYLYATAYLPVRNIAIATALAHMAGLAGRAWNVNASGLNLFIVIIAKSGIGKDAIHSGTNLLSTACTKQFPYYSNFIDTSSYASSEAFERSIRDRPSFVNTMAEFGKTLTRMTSGREPQLDALLGSFTKVYTKSGRNQSVGALVYSKKENSVSAPLGPVAFSFIGESTPEVFKKAVTSTIIEDGFMSRLTIFEYRGERVADNLAGLEHSKVVPPEIVTNLVNIAQQAHQMNNADTVADVAISPEAQHLLTSLRETVRVNVNSASAEDIRAMWNRAGLQVHKIAALLAVADNYLNPVITIAHARWAFDLIKNIIRTRSGMLKSMARSLPTDPNREKRLRRFLVEYMTGDVPDKEALFRSNAIIRHSYIMERCFQMTVFKQPGKESSQLIGVTMRSLLDSGLLIEVPKSEMSLLYKRAGRGYRISLEESDVRKVKNSVSKNPEPDVEYDQSALTITPKPANLTSLTEGAY